MTDHSREAFLVGGLTAVALALRLLGLAEGDFWADELDTRRVVDRAPGEVLIAVQDNEGAPHLYYLLAWAWSGIFGAGEAGIRSLSAVAGALVTPVAYLTLRQVDLRTEAVIAGALAAVSPLLVWYSQEARVYSLYALLTAAALFFFVRVLVSFSRPALIGWSIASAAALLTHYFALFAIAGMAAVLLYRHSARWQSIALSLLPAAVTEFALLPTVALQRSSKGQDWISEIPLQERLLQVPEHFLTGFSYPPLAVLLVAGLLAATGGIALLIHSQRGRLVGGSLLGVVAASIGLPILAIAVNTDLVNSRNLLGAMLPLSLAISVGLGAPRLRPAGPIIAIALVGLLAGISIAGEHDHEVERPPWRAAAQAIAKDGEPDLVVACCGILAEPAAHYFAGFGGFEDGASGDVEVRQVVVATIRRPDRRPTNDFCWWGGPCQGDDALGPGKPPANPGALSQAFSSIFGRADTLTRGSITLERYRSATPISLGARSGVRLREGVVVVDNETAVNGVQLLVRRR